MSLRNYYFTPRQLDIIWYMYARPDDKHAQIAAYLGISVNTLNTHMRDIYAAAGVKTDTGLMTQLFKADWFVAQPDYLERQGDICK